jgi:hypothetical protein
MRSETARIHNLHLRVPGLNREEAMRFGNEVARRVAEGLPRGRTLELGALDLKVRVPAGTPKDRLAQVVADRILVGLS